MEKAISQPNGFQEGVKSRPFEHRETEKQMEKRKGRELPIVPDVVALSLFPAADQKVELRLTEDGHAHDELVLVRRPAR